MVGETLVIAEAFHSGVHGGGSVFDDDMAWHGVDSGLEYRVIVVSIHRYLDIPLPFSKAVMTRPLSLDSQYHVSDNR